MLKSLRHHRQICRVCANNASKNHNLCMLRIRGAVSCVGGGVAAEAINHSDAQEVHQLLANELREAQAAADFKAKCQQVFR